jgi:hypothetical protein
LAQFFYQLIGDLMSPYLPRLLIAAAALLPLSSMAADDADHSKHHPAAAVAPADKTPAVIPTKTEPTTPKQFMAAMQTMHEKMIQAKTQDERKALAHDHMKMMHEGMEMMKKMSPAANEKPSADMMQQKMEMMQMMMESMMDHMDSCMTKP